MANKGGFSWKRALGVTKMKTKISRKTGIPLTKSGRQRKIGKMVTGGGCVIPLIMFVLAVAILISFVSCTITSNKSNGNDDVKETVNTKNTEKTEGTIKNDPTIETTTQSTLTSESISSTAQTSTKTTNITESAENPIKLLYLSSPISVNNTATIKIQGEAKTEYKIAVYYKSGKSNANGLEKKTSDSNGIVSWSWDIGPKTSPGEFEIVISGGGQQFKTKITITQ